MALQLDIVGMTHKYSRTYVVGREKIREFAQSVKAVDPASLDPSADMTASSRPWPSRR